MKKKQRKIRKRNPNDSTFRNINALKKRVLCLEKILVHLGLLSWPSLYNKIHHQIKKAGGLKK